MKIRMRSPHVRGRGSLASFAAMATVGAALSIQSAALAQQDKSHSGNDHSNNDSHYHSVRTDHERTARRDDAQKSFTHSTEARQFDNGVRLRQAVPYQGRDGFVGRPGEVGERRPGAFAQARVYAYPHYYFQRTSTVAVVVSPFSFYVGVFPPFIARSAVIIAPPPIVYVSAPVYVDGYYQGYPGGGGYYLSAPREDFGWRQDPSLKQSVYDLEDTFLNDDISLLAPLTDPNTKISIFTKGQYQYSLQPNDYLDMTRDFMRSAHTTDFSVYRVKYRTTGVYQVFAKHTYQDGDGETRSVYLCIVLDRSTGHWAITQVDTSPDRIES